MSDTKKRSNLQWITIIGAIITTILTIWIYLVQFQIENSGGAWDPWFVYYKDLLPVGWNFVAIILTILVLRAFGARSGPGFVWFLFILGLISWLCGEIIWTYDEAFLGIISPYPSPADYLYIVGYIFFIFGIQKQLRLTQAKISKQELGIILGFVGILALITIIFVISPIVMDIIANEYQITENIISFAYPILDIILGASAFTLVLRFKGGKFSTAWLMIGIGFIMMIVYDLFFTGINYSETYILYYIIDHFYNAFYMLLAIGAAYFQKVIQDI
jgi:hypothetical protein